MCVCSLGDFSLVLEFMNAAIVNHAPMTQFAAKEVVNAIADGSNADAAFERWAARWRLSPDGVEGPQAFLGRRQPVFSWRPDSP